MHFNILTIFPEMFPGTFGGGVDDEQFDTGQEFAAKQNVDF